jgi:hypothetical protein
MSRLAQRLTDKRVLKLIRAFLQAGIFAEGLMTLPREGTPQGSPLSPFLSTVVLDELDKELEDRGHRFCRYADDSNIYVRSARAGARGLASLSGFSTRRLKLKVTWRKSPVDRPWKRSFLGFSCTGGKRPKRRKIAPKALARFNARVKARTRRNHGQQPQARHHDPHSVSERVDWLCWVLPTARSVARLGPLDSSPSTLPPVETLEGGPPTQGRAAQAWDSPGVGAHDGLECARAMEDQSYTGRTHGAQQSLL